MNLVYSQIQYKYLYKTKSVIQVMEVHYVEAHAKTKLNKNLVEKIKNYCKNEQVGIYTTIQYINQAKELANEIENLEFRGQVLGCRVPSSGEEKILYLGTGKFHPIGIAIKVGENKEIYTANPETLEFKELDRKLLRKLQNLKVIMRDKILHSKKVGILVSVKPGQNLMYLANKTKKWLAEKGIKSYILVGNEVLPHKLLDFYNFDAFVNTACPRIFEDYKSFEKPIINAIDLLHPKF